MYTHKTQTVQILVPVMILLLAAALGGINTVMAAQSEEQAPKNYTDQQEETPFFGGPGLGIGDYQGPLFPSTPLSADLNHGVRGANVDECLNPAYVFTGEAAGNFFGWRVSSAGDVNGDGYDDIIMGAMLNSAGGDLAGQAYVFSGENGDTLYVLTGAAPGDQFGSAVGSAGDVNQDGYDDMLVGAWGSDAGGDFSGQAYLFYGGPGPFPIHIAAADADWTVAGGGYGYRLGGSVSGVGDVDGDNVPDFIIGGGHWTAGDYGELRVYSGQTLDTIRTHTDEDSASSFGYSSSVAGDVNNDGTNDYIVGAISGDAAYVYSGSDGSLLYLFNGWTTGGYDAFGGHVSGAGDLNNDGYADLIVGAPWYPGNGNYFGRAYVFFGGPGPYPITETVADADYIFTGEPNNMLGWSVTDLEDVDGDNINDFAVGAMGWAGLTGYALIYSGQTGTLLYTINGQHGNDWFGRDIAGNGDYDNDGINDLLVGSPANNADGSADSSGRVFVYYLGDADFDGVLTGCDNCPADSNPDQADLDGDGIGDICDDDMDGDGVLNIDDNCPMTDNPDQTDTDNDGIGDACDDYCCQNRGDIDHSGQVNVADISYMVDYLFRGGPPPVCVGESDVDGSGFINVADLTYLVDYLFRGGPAPAACP